MKIVSPSPQTTRKLAALFAREITKLKNRENALVVGLTGDLGSGKTAFVQGFARGLGVKKHITSPTFLIIRSYKLPSYRLPVTNYRDLYHIDCYRLKKSKELTVLDFKKIITNSENIVLIEWADKIKRLLPKNTLWIKFEHRKKENERIIRIGRRI